MSSSVDIVPLLNRPAQKARSGLRMPENSRRAWAENIHDVGRTQWPGFRKFAAFSLVVTGSVAAAPSASRFDNRSTAGAALSGVHIGPCCNVRRWNSLCICAACDIRVGFSPLSWSHAFSGALSYRASSPVLANAKHRGKLQRCLGRMRSGIPAPASAWGHPSLVLRLGHSFPPPTNQARCVPALLGSCSSPHGSKQSQTRPGVFSCASRFEPQLRIRPDGSRDDAKPSVHSRVENGPRKTASIIIGSMPDSFDGASRVAARTISSSRFSWQTAKLLLVRSPTMEIRWS